MENSGYWDHLCLFLEIAWLFCQCWFKGLSHLVRSWVEWRGCVAIVSFRAHQGSDSSSDFSCLRWDPNYQRVFLGVPAATSALSILEKLSHRASQSRKKGSVPREEKTACHLLLGRLVASGQRQLCCPGAVCPSVCPSVCVPRLHSWDPLSIPVPPPHDSVSACRGSCAGKTALGCSAERPWMLLIEDPCWTSWEKGLVSAPFPQQ